MVPVGVVWFCVVLLRFVSLHPRNQENQTDHTTKTSTQRNANYKKQKNTQLQKKAKNTNDWKVVAEPVLVVAHDGVSMLQSFCIVRMPISLQVGLKGEWNNDHYPFSSELTIPISYIHVDTSTITSTPPHHDIHFQFAYGTGKNKNKLYATSSTLEQGEPVEIQYHTIYKHLSISTPPQQQTYQITNYI